MHQDRVLPISRRIYRALLVQSHHLRHRFHSTLRHSAERSTGMRSRRIRIAEQEMTIKYIATNGRKADAMDGMTCGRLRCSMIA